MAPDLGEGLTQGTAESFSCINCLEDKLLSESGHYCHRVCQQCIIGLAVSLADQGYKSIFCPCGDQLSLEALEPLLPVDLYRQLFQHQAQSPVSTTASFQLRTVREMTRDEKIRQLEKFEIVFLQPDQVQEFREVFEAGVRYECSASLYLSWLPLKLDSMETEQEVLDRFFTDKTPSNLQKKQTARKVRKPEGSARFDPLSMERHGMEEWKEIWEDQDQAKKEKEEKKKETERRALERKEKKKEIEKKKEEKRKEKEAKARPSSAEQEKVDSSLISPPGLSTRGRPKRRLRGTVSQGPAKSGPLLPRPDSPPPQPPPNLPSSPLPSQPQPANVRRGRKRISRVEGNLEDIFFKKQRK